MPGDERWGRGMHEKYNQEGQLMTGNRVFVPVRGCLNWPVKAQTFPVLRLISSGIHDPNTFCCG